MSKKDYISDNLITMRDRLRESTAAIREAAEQKKTDLPSPAEPQMQPPSGATAADRRMEEGFRAKQDLACRLGRDQAKVATLITGTEQKLRNLQQIQETLQMQEAKLGQITPTGSAGLFAAEIDRLRLEYFRVCGALDTIVSGVERVERSGREAFPKEDMTIRSAWIIGGAILAGAAIIAGITAVIFL